MIRALAVLALGLAACGGPDPVCGPTTTTDAETVEPGSFLEGELDLEIGSTVEFRWQSTGALLYDIHIHDGDEVTNLLEGVSTGETLTLTAERDGFHYPMFTNSTDVSQDVTVEVVLDAGGCWNSWL